MSTLKRPHRQARSRRSGKPAFTLLELIVVLLVLGILAAIAVPTFNTVKENSVKRVAQTTLEAAARNGEAIAKSDLNASDEAIATAVESEFTDANGLTVTVSGDTVTVTQVSGSITASGSVEFVDGVGTITAAAIAGGGGGGSPLTWGLAVHTTGYTGPGNENFSLGSSASFNRTTKVATFETLSLTDGSCIGWTGRDLAVSTDDTAWTPTVVFTGSRPWGGPTENTFFQTIGATMESQPVGTKSGSCTYTIDLGAIETILGVTWSDSDLQNLYFQVHNGSGYMRWIKITAS